MQFLDWTVLGAYLAGMLALAFYLGQRQTSREDYYLGGHRLPGWALAGSIIATQCSTNSLLGAPAFVGFSAGGGLLWLQYELAVPLAMLLLCALFLPIYRSRSISIYAYLEKRLGLQARLLASACFLFFRGVATGVTVYGVAAVIGLITGIPFTAAVLLLMGITITYDVLGGMRAVVISDVLQMALLLAAVFLALFWLAEPLSLHWHSLADRTRPLLDDWGLSSGNNYGFWPMLLGGLFLYTAYYGCDQSQAQRLQSARDESQLYRILVLNGVLRFPLVLAYCLVGLGLAAYAVEHPGFVAALPHTAAGSPNLNLVFPAFVAANFPAGLAGLAIVGLFAAAMSSIDSALNSLSAGTVEDFIARFRPLPEKRLFLLSKLATLGWGLFAVAFSFQVERIAPTVLEAINKVGSMANGPLLMLFTLAILWPALGQRAAIAGFLGGLACNLLIWAQLPQVSWLWWNVSGFLAGWLCAVAVGLGRLILPSAGFPLWVPRRQGLQLAAMTVLILLVCTLLQFA
ncbi:sodium:solute symporter family transporter [Haliea sp. E17]|uniref:sodium:solute symporter family transporter n=1 Tax=Haliea sp. E17 TaxID=3401576 RepID=UPI003AB0E57C